MLETLIVQHGAPTLAGLKMGSLFSVKPQCSQRMQQDVARVNQSLEPKGVRLVIMKVSDQHILFYLYRKAQLAQCIACPKAIPLLIQCGYRQLSVCGVLSTLREKLAQDGEFPHEIGLFLGYPLSDVTGFIRHRGKNCLLCGCWKVYQEEEKAIRRFAQYRKCTGIYAKMFQNGYPLTKLTVAVQSA